MLSLLGFGKRRRKTSKKGMVKKPSSKLLRMCKKLRIKTTVKRGKRRIYRKVKVLKKLCKRKLRLLKKRKLMMAKKLKNSHRRRKVHRRRRFGN